MAYHHQAPQSYSAQVSPLLHAHSSTSDNPSMERKIHHEPKTGIRAWLDATKIACFVVHLIVLLAFIILSFYPFGTVNDMLGPNVESYTKYLDKTWEGNADFSTSTSSRAAVAGVTGHLIGLFFSTVMVLMAQWLALRRQLNMHGPLTAKHDTDTAWSGLGSSLVTLARQVSQRSSLLPILRALAYFGGIALFNTTAAALFGVVYVNQTEMVTFQTAGLPSFSTSLSNLMTGASALLTIGSIDYLSLPGFTAGTIFDLPVNPTTQMPATPSYETSATYFNVTCGYLGDHAWINATEDGQRFLATDYQMRQMRQIPVPHIISQNGLSVITAPWGLSLEERDPVGLVFLSTIPISDSDGNFAPTSVVSPPMTYISNSSEQVSVNSVTAMACNLTIIPMAATVDSFNSTLLSLSNNTQKTSSTMGEFPREIRTAPFNDTDPMDVLYSAWAIMTLAETPSPDGFAYQTICQTNGNEVCDIITAVDQFSMQELGVFPDIIFSDVPPNSTLALHDIEGMLSNMTAIYFWSQARGQNHKFNNLMFARTLDVPIDLALITHESEREVFKDTVMYILTLNMAYAYFGVAISLFLFILVLPLVFDRNTLPVHSGGILPMIWLLSGRDDVTRGVCNVEDPTTTNLRKAGMVDASFAYGGVAGRKDVIV